MRDEEYNVVGQYACEGDGKRIRKYVPSTGETTVFVYDASGKTVAEYSTKVESAATAKVSYLTNDHLGSPRITTDAVGQVVSRRDFMPFGEEIARANYGSDSVRQKFTLYERDTETDLDYAQARMYAKSLGRFTTVDPLMASAQAESPQTWNRYEYVLNNPLKYTDSDGLDPTPHFKDFKDLSEDEQRILNASKVQVTVTIDGKSVNEIRSGKELYDTLSAKDNKEGNKQLAGFLNQTAQLANITFNVNGESKTALSYVQSVTSIAQDRIIANVDPGLKTLISSDSRFSDAPGHEGHPDSWKDNRPREGGLQVSFSKDGKSLDADTDYGNIKVKTNNPFKKLGGILEHGVEVGQNTLTGSKTNPYKVYDILTKQRGIQPNYTTTKK